MQVKTELVKKHISSLICDSIYDILEIDADKIADTKAIDILEEIKAVIQKDEEDFEIVEEIVCIFERYGIDAGACHDFG